ncbi:uncharacterized protein [Hetaerina americana]|uniref:uncharacterized protein n=1 Tax=Hetaerina americana TaxID=62018 RepID=UPI003A7F5AED
MDVSSMLDTDSDRLCRLCLESNGEMVYIFDPKGYNGIRVWEVIKELLQLEVSREDGLPRTICGGCLRKVSDFKNFKTICIKSKISILTMIASRGMVGCCSTQPLSKTKQEVQVKPSAKVGNTALNGSEVNREIIEILDDMYETSNKMFSGCKNKDINKATASQSTLVSQPESNVPKTRASSRKLEAGKTEERPVAVKQRTSERTSKYLSANKVSSLRESARAKSRKSSTETRAKYPRPGTTPSTSSENATKVSSSSSEINQNKSSSSSAEKPSSCSSSSSTDKGTTQNANVSSIPSAPKQVMKRPPKAPSNSKPESVPSTASGVQSSIKAEASSNLSRKDEPQSSAAQKKVLRSQKGNGLPNKSVHKGRGKKRKEVTVDLEGDASGTVNFIEVPVTEDGISIVSEINNEVSADPLAPIKSEVLDKDYDVHLQVNQRQDWVPGAIYDSVYSNLGPVKQESFELPISGEGNATVSGDVDSFGCSSTESSQSAVTVKNKLKTKRKQSSDNILNISIDNIYFYYHNEPSMPQLHPELNPGEVGAFVPMQVERDEAMEVEME